MSLTQSTRTMLSETREATGSARHVAGVMGASGTSGAELVRLLAQHPRVSLGFATARSAAGAVLDEIDPGAPPVRLQHPEEVSWSDADVVFLCVPHEVAGDVAGQCLRAGCRVIDLSGDHRITDRNRHAEVYGSSREQSLADEAVYGLTELERERIQGCRLVSNPGCYATAAGLALAPLAETDVLRGIPVIDGKSGISGAGRAATATSHFCSVAEDVRPYRPGRAHRHVAEIEQLLDRKNTRRMHRIVFTPHLVPLERGIEATIVLQDVPGGADCVRRTLERRYRDEPFVRVLAAGREARIRGVARTNRADLGVFPVDGIDGSVVLTVAIDNLLKGAAGQAVQNMNAMLGHPEGLGLTGARTDRAGDDEPGRTR